MAFAILTSNESGADSLTDINANFALASTLESPTFTTSITTPITYGSSAANGDHIIEGTSNATKTTSYVQVQPTVGDIVFGPNTNAGKGKLVVQDVGTGYVAIGDLDSQPDYGGLAISGTLNAGSYTLAQGVVDTNLYINRPAGKSIIFRIGAASTDMTLSSAGDLTLPTPGTSSTSVVTIGATQTLTGKTLTSPIVSSGSRLSFGTTIEEKIRFYDTGTASTSYGMGTIASCTQIFSGATGDVAIYRGGTAGTQMARWVGGTDFMVIGTVTPTAKLHLDAGNATASCLKFTAGTTTGTASTDGLDFGITATGVGEIRQNENQAINVYVNNTTLAATFTAAGNLQVTTQAAGDNTTNAATTAFVQAAKVGYVLGGGKSITNPIDSTTYYFGAGSGFSAFTVEGTYSRFYVPKAGTVKAVYCWFNQAGTAGSSETSTVSLRLNATTDTTISAVVQNDQATNTGELFSNTGMSVAVVAGDFLEIKWVTPAWVTNPGQVGMIVTIYIE